MSNYSSPLTSIPTRSRRMREETSRWLTRAEGLVRNPRSVFEQTVRKIVQERLPGTWREVHDTAALSPQVSVGHRPPPRRPGAGVALSAEPPSRTYRPADHLHQT